MITRPSIDQYTKEYKRKRMPNIRSLGGIYYGVSTDNQYQSFNYPLWEEWNCRRCRYDILTNKEETLQVLHENKKLYACNIQGDLLFDMFEGKPIPKTTLLLLGMNRYGVGTCAEFEEYVGENNDS